MIFLALLSSTRQKISFSFHLIHFTRFNVKLSFIDTIHENYDRVVDDSETFVKSQ